MERRYRGHSRSTSGTSTMLDYPTNERSTNHMVTPQAQISNNRRENHHGHHHHHHHGIGHKQSREGPTPFDDDGDNASIDNEAIQRDANGGYGDNFEIPHRMLRIIMPELFEHLSEGYNEPHLSESINYSQRYANTHGQECERPRGQRLDIDTVRALNKQRVASLADDAWMYEAEEDPNPTRYRKQLYYR